MNALSNNGPICQKYKAMTWIKSLHWCSPGFILSFFMYLVNQYDVLATKQLHRTFSIMWLQNYNDSSSLSGIYHCHWFIIVTGSSLSLMHHCHWCIPVTDSSLSRIRYCHLFFTVTDSSLVQWFFTVTGSLSLSMMLQY